jgi:hypothetical protein
VRFPLSEITAQRISYLKLVAPTGIEPVLPP